MSTGPTDTDTLMPAFASDLFRAVTQARPEQVWAALTATGSPQAYLRLYVDELRPEPGAGDELEVAWLPVLCGLVAQLNQAAAAG